MWGGGVPYKAHGNCGRREEAQVTPEAVESGPQQVIPPPPPVRHALQVGRYTLADFLSTTLLCLWTPLLYKYG